MFIQHPFEVEVGLPLLLQLGLEARRVMSTYGTLTHRPPATEHNTGTRRAGARPMWSINADPHVMIRLKRLLPRAESCRTGAVSVADTPEAARDLQWICERWPLDMDLATTARLQAQVRVYRHRQEAIDDILSGGSGALPFDLEPARPPARPASIRRSPPE